jgi:hypothetical protein
MAEQAGIDIALQVATVAVSKATSTTLSVNKNNPDATTKDSDWEAVITGKVSGSISFEGLYDDSVAASGFQFIDDIIAGDEIALRFARTDTPAVGEPSYYAANGLVSSVEISANDDEVATISATIELTGTISATKA